MTAQEFVSFLDRYIADKTPNFGDGDSVLTLLYQRCHRALETDPDSSTAPERFLQNAVREWCPESGCHRCGEEGVEEKSGGTGSAKACYRKRIRHCPHHLECSIRVYLKTVNMPKQRVFSACCAPFSLVIHKVFLRKNGFSRRKIPRCWSYSRFSDRP